jgi:hypothetical protein
VSREYRLLVTGSREWRDEGRVRATLRACLDKWGCPAAAAVVVHGAARGLDSIADGVAKQLGMRVEPYPVPRWAWRKEYAGLRAGHERNALMVRLGADGCAAFPLGLSAGTRGCMVICEDAQPRIPVWLRGDPPIPDGCYQVTDGGVCAGFEIHRGLIVQCAPKLRRDRARWWAAVAAGDRRVRRVGAPSAPTLATAPEEETCHDIS